MAVHIKNPEGSTEKEPLELISKFINITWLLADVLKPADKN